MLRLMGLHITGDAASDEILADPFALLLGMLLDHDSPIRLVGVDLAEQHN